MIRARKLRKLFEACMADKTVGRAGYKAKLNEALGIEEGANGEPTINQTTRWVDGYVFSPQEMAMEFFGRDWKEQIDPRNFHHASQQAEIMEAGGSVVMPSHFSNISAFNDTIGGLVSAMVIEAYQHPDFIGNDMCTETPAPDPWVDGGRMIGIMNDAGAPVGQNLPHGVPYPTVGEKETYITLPKLERRGNAIQINEAAFRFDRTGEIEERARNTGYNIGRNREIRIADTVLGVENTYSRDGNASHTYHVDADSVPNDYVNTWTDDLTDYTNINTAFMVLQGNTDPGTGYEVSIQAPTILVTPFKAMTLRTILTATTVRHASSGDLTQIQYAPNPVNVFTPAFGMKWSYIWYNRMIAAGSNAAFAQARWYFGDFKKAFGYRQYIPFESRTLPITGEEMKRDIIFSHLCREWGVPFVKEPRYVGRQVNHTVAADTVGG